jgi:hypothetical protein
MSGSQLVNRAAACATCRDRRSPKAITAAHVAASGDGTGDQPIARHPTPPSAENHVFTEAPVEYADS